jgi:thiamine biosynthesis protein ThiS
MSSTMEIVLNGDRTAVPCPATLEALLRHLGLDPRMVVVEHNRTIVRRPQLATTPLASGDTVELVHFVGGG